MVGFVLSQIISIAGDLYKLALIAYVVISWIHIPANRWTELLRRIIEPALGPVRVFMHRVLPANWMRTFDWSTLALYILISIVQSILTGLVRILL